MNISRRSLLSGLIVAPAVILTPGLLMPVKPWMPVIYGDGTYDDWAGLQALLNSQDVDIRSDRLFLNYPRSTELGFMAVNTPFALSRPLVFPVNTFQRNTFCGCSFLKHRQHQSDNLLIFEQGEGRAYAISSILAGSTYTEGQIVVGHHKDSLFIHPARASYDAPETA